MFWSSEVQMKQFFCGFPHLTGTDARRVRPQFIGNSLLKVRLIKDARTVRPYQPIKHSSAPKICIIPVITLIKTFAPFAPSREVISPRITGITRNFIRVIRVIRVQKKKNKCIVFLRESRNKLSKRNHFIFVVWTQIAQIARILFVRFIDLREVLYPRITRRNSLIRVITLIKTFATFAPMREKNTRDPRDTLETNNQHDFTDETVFQRSAILFVWSVWLVFKKRKTNVLCSYANLAMNFQKVITLFLLSEHKLHRLHEYYLWDSKICVRYCIHESRVSRGETV